MKKHTILFLAANPSGTDRLALDREAHAIQVELDRSGWRDHFQFVTCWATEPVDLLRELRRTRPTVVHFSGHGDRGPGSEQPCSPALTRDIVVDGLGSGDDAGGSYSLVFQSADGTPRRVSAAALRDAFGAAGTSVRLVVLNACYSEAAAVTLLAHVDCVVGIAGAIRDDVARSFAIGFYGGLGEGESIAAAHLGGCAAIGLEGFADGDRAHFKVRQGTDASTLTLAEPERPSRGNEVLGHGGSRFAGREPHPRAVRTWPQHGGEHGTHGAPKPVEREQVDRSAKRRAKVVAPLGVAAITGTAGLGLLVLMLSSGPALIGLGLTAYIWYVLLLLLGLAAAITVFSVFKSYARYTGRVLGGTLELGGPIVMTLLVIVLGFYLVPAPALQFDVTVFLHGESGDQALVVRNTGKLTLDLGADRRIESVGDKGEVRYPGVSANMRGQQVSLALIDDKYELVDSHLTIRLDRDVYYAAVRAKRLLLAGYVADEAGRPLAHVRASIARADAMTNEDGRFEIMLPADLPEGERTITIVASGYKTQHLQVVPGGNPLQVRLSASEGSENTR